MSLQPGLLPPDANHRLRDCALLVLDFDGVLTDNRVIVHDDGREAVVCCRGDGMGIKLLKDAGVPVVILSTETNPVVTARASKLDVPVQQGLENKHAAFRALCASYNLDPVQTVFVGNDINDVRCLQAAGLAVVPADAHPAARAVADVVLAANGGHGAVRELVDAILAAKEVGWPAVEADA